MFRTERCAHFRISILEFRFVRLLTLSLSSNEEERESNSKIFYTYDFD